MQSLSVFADGIQFNCYQVKLSSIGSSQLDTGEYADLVGAEGREKREPPSRDDGGKKKKKLIRQRTTGLGNVFVLYPLSALDCYTDKCMACRRPV